MQSYSVKKIVINDQILQQDITSFVPPSFNAKKSPYQSVEMRSEKQIIVGHEPLELKFSYAGSLRVLNSFMVEQVDITVVYQYLLNTKEELLVLNCKGKISGSERDKYFSHEESVIDVQVAVDFLELKDGAGTELEYIDVDQGVVRFNGKPYMWG